MIRPVRCKRGHPWDEANTRWIKHANGRKYRQCRACANHLLRLRYRNDDAWREREKQRSLERYYMVCGGTHAE